jgi:hypothetical protein
LGVRIKGIGCEVEQLHIVSRWFVIGKFDGKFGLRVQTGWDGSLAL